FGKGTRHIRGQELFVQPGGDISLYSPIKMVVLAQIIVQPDEQKSIGKDDAVLISDIRSECDDFGHLKFRKIVFDMFEKGLQSLGFLLKIPKSPVHFFKK